MFFMDESGRNIQIKNSYIFAFVYDVLDLDKYIHQQIYVINLI